MPNANQMFIRRGLLVTALWLAGCHSSGSSPPRPQLADGRHRLTSVLPNYYVILDTPIVEIADGITSISGTLHRKPGIRWTLAGRIDIEFVSPNGHVLDALPALITPRLISMDPNVSSVYSTNYGYVPPPGTIVRVHFVDSDTQAREDIEGTGFSPGGRGGGRGGHR